MPIFAGIFRRVRFHPRARNRGGFELPPREVRSFLPQPWVHRKEPTVISQICVMANSLTVVSMISQASWDMSLNLIYIGSSGGTYVN